MKDRFQYLDNSKAILIVLVILGHVIQGSIEDYQHKYIILMFGIMLIMNALSGRDGSIYWTAPFMISALLFIVSRNPYRFAWL